jgi:hypothetical protein
MHDLRCPIAVVAHDAGAANLIIAWLKSWGKPVRAHMRGPAAALWEKSFPSEPLFHSHGDVLQGVRSLVSGTGWASTFEHDARVIASELGLYSVAVLDHWVNYSMRFIHNNRVQWPDELWVADQWAVKIAQKEIPQVPVRLLKNLYLEDQVTKITPAPSTGTLLYVLEPVRQTWGCNQEGEFQALEFALKQIDRLYPARVSRILLRPHPSESPAKYEKYILSDERVEMDTSKDVASAISLADVVVGVESFALTVALAAGRTVYSSLPPWAPPLRLPHSGIRQIRYLEFE